MSFLETAKQALATCSQNEPQASESDDRNDKSPESLEFVLKGHAVELYLADGQRLFIVADEEDAARLGEPRGTVYTAAEARRVIQIGDPAVVADVHRLKREFDGKIRAIALSPALTKAPIGQPPALAPKEVAR